MAPAVYIAAAAVALRCPVATAATTKYYVCSAPQTWEEGVE